MKNRLFSQREIRQNMPARLSRTQITDAGNIKRAQESQATSIVRIPTRTIEWLPAGSIIEDTSIWPAGGMIISGGTVWPAEGIIIAGGILRSTAGFSLMETTESATLSSENYVNKHRLETLRLRFTKQLIELINEEDFEYGIENKTDLLIKDQMNLNSLATKDWINSIFVENFSNPTILIGILRIIGRLDYISTFPEGQTMAVAALSHSNVEVQECGVRAFENWGTLESLQILENLTVSTKWLQDYIDQVVQDLKKEINAPVS